MVIDATENHKVKTIDVPGASMQADMDDLVHVHFTGGMVDKLSDTDHELYEPCTIMEQGQHVLHVEL